MPCLRILKSRPMPNLYGLGDILEGFLGTLSELVSELRLYEVVSRLRYAYAPNICNILKAACHVHAIAKNILFFVYYIVSDVNPDTQLKLLPFSLLRI